jgi:hypothetical protein
MVYRSSKPINAYREWSMTGIDTATHTVETIIRQGNDLAEFQQNVRDRVDEGFLHPPLVSIHLVTLRYPRMARDLAAKHIRVIEGAVAENTGYKRSQFRQLVAMSDLEHVSGVENMSFPKSKPDFVLVEVPLTSDFLTPALDASKVKWR